MRLIVNRYPYCIQRLQELEASYPTWNSTGKASTSQKTTVSTEGEKGKAHADKRYVMPPHPSNTSNNIIPVNPDSLTYLHHFFTFAKRLHLPVSGGNPWEHNGIPSLLYGFGLKAHSLNPVAPISHSLKFARPPFLKNGKNG